MYKDHRYINAGENEIYRWGHKAQDKLREYLTPNESGFYSMPADGGNYWTIGTSDGQYGEFAKIGDKFLSVNKRGMIWAKVGTEKAEIFIQMVNDMLAEMESRMGRNEEAEEVEENEEEQNKNIYFENSKNINTSKNKKVLQNKTLSGLVKIVEQHRQDSWKVVGDIMKGNDGFWVFVVRI